MLRTISSAIMLLLLLLTSLGVQRAPPADTEAERVEQIIAAMDTRARVGQLFMIEFVGAFTSDADTVAELIGDYGVGTVILGWHNNNILNDQPDTPVQVAGMTNRLQAYVYRQHRQQTEDGDTYFLPLFIAVDHEGDGYPRTHLRTGFTPIPSAMAIGATWSEQEAEQVGKIIGQELRAVGVNMLLGPVLDVLADPHPEGKGDMNIRVFGGDPHWVGQLGRAYIRGVHEGSDGKVLTVAKHFPGHGASDRYPDDEVSTVNKSLDDLMDSDLVPFLEVTRLDADDVAGMTDAMMPSHIRYRGFQGDVSQLTSPISLDAVGMDVFFEQPTLAIWRANGGLIVCDSLGVTGLERFYAPGTQEVPHRTIARDALMAGNDILPILFSVHPNWVSGSVPVIKDTIDYFAAQYESDSQFRIRVDDALRHIVAAKLHLYPGLSLEETQVQTVTVDESVGGSLDVIQETALAGLTLIYPSRERLQLDKNSRGDRRFARCSGVY
ncbi:MAG: glycoside hydrolase family 3 N-terminal domain-containing protein, partial [Anaerolineae bacterium]